MVFTITLTSAVGPYPYTLQHLFISSYPYAKLDRVQVRLYVLISSFPAPSRVTTSDWLILRTSFQSSKAPQFSLDQRLPKYGPLYRPPGDSRASLTSATLTIHICLSALTKLRKSAIISIIPVC